MSQLSWNEIRTRASQFAVRWSDAAQENAEAQTFWNEFLRIYGIDRRRVAAFERRVDGLATGSGRGRVDVLWPGLFLAEHKTRGRDLGSVWLSFQSQRMMQATCTAAKNWCPRFS